MNNRILINFDKRVITLLFLCLILFCISVFFKIHGSSVTIWDTRFIDASRQCLVWGKPKFIRSDEWSVMTPAIVSQSNQTPRFPIHNGSLGAEKTPLLINVPVRHFSMLFRPQYWGFFIFDFERGFSFYWNFKNFGLFLSFFILLLLMTGNNFWLSFCGSLWMFYSSFTQWWFSTPAMMPEMITSFSISIVTLLYMMLSNKKKHLIIASLFFVVFFVNFYLCYYPAFQIPLLYLLLFIVFGSYLTKFKYSEIKLFAKSKFRVITLSLSILAVILVLYFIYCDTQNTISIVKNTFYPGARISLGRGLGITHIFSGLYNVFLTEDYFPKKWVNICEASNFILISPLLLIAFFKNLKLWVKKELLMIGLLLYQFFLIIWMVLGFPKFLAHAALFFMVPSRRALIGLGISNIILTTIFVSKKEYSNNYNFFKNILFFIIIFILFIFHGLFLNSRLDYFFTKPQIVFVSVVYASFAFALFSKKKVLLVILICLAVVIPNFMINPVSISLAPILKKEATIFVSKIKLKDPKSKWIVFGDPHVANFLKASGVFVFNGTKAVPDINRLKVLDPGLENYNVYNRYALIEIMSSEDRNKVNFYLDSHQSYSIMIHPCNEKLLKMGINYFVFTYKPKEYEVEDMTPLTLQPINGLWIYRHK